MNNLYKIIILLITLSSCGSDTESLNKIRKKIRTKDCKSLRQADNLWTLHGSPFTGDCEEIENDITIASATFKDGYFHGTVIFRYPNGQLEETSDYVNGAKHGQSITYHKNGHINEKSSWDNNELTDSVFCYFTNGNPYYIGGFKNGKQDGRWEIYDSLSGNLIEYYHYENGEIISIDSIVYNQ